MCAACAQYLEDLECPLDYNANSAQSQAILDWLLHHAVDLMYEDHGARSCGRHQA